jgi:DNA-binding MarR family transcriptional regulator
VDLSEPPPTETQDIGTSERAPEQTLQQVCDSIWKLTEDVLELLRSRATSQVQARKRPDVLWVDDVTRAQGNTVIAIKQLCDTNPEGVSLKKLAETIGVTPAAASVMVDLLVAKKMIKRTRSKNDRRAILLRLTPQTAQLFEISTQSLGEAVMSLADEMGPDMLRDWQRILVTASAVLRRKMGVSPPDESERPDESEGPEPSLDDTRKPRTADEA